jgi:hypothetical protein
VYLLNSVVLKQCRQGHCELSDDQRATSDNLRPSGTRTGQLTAAGVPLGPYRLIYVQVGIGECEMGVGQPRIDQTD